MNKYYILLICFMFLLNGCSATGLVDCEGEYAYNPDVFTVEEQGWIEESAARWNTWVGYTVLVVKPGHRDLCSIHDGTPNDPTKIGQIRHPTESITINKAKMKDFNKYNQSYFEAVTMHELGHGLGFKHLGENGKALMAPAGALDFTDIDLEQCIELGICKDAK